MSRRNTGLGNSSRGSRPGRANCSRMSEAIADFMQYARDVGEEIESANFEAERRTRERLNVQAIVKEGHFKATCVLEKW